MKNIQENVLREELSYYQKKKPDFLKTYKDQYVLIKDGKLVGAFTKEEEAYKAGVQKFGNASFLIKKVVENEETAEFPALTVGLINVCLQ